MESHLSSSPLLLGAWKFSAAPPSLTGVANKKLFPYSRYGQRERGEGAAKIFHLLSSISFFASDFLARSLSLLLPPSTLLSQEASLLPSHPPSFWEVSSFFLFCSPRLEEKEKGESCQAQAERGELVQQNFSDSYSFLPSSPPRLLHVKERSSKEFLLLCVFLSSLLTKKLP